MKTADDLSRKKFACNLKKNSVWRFSVRMLCAGYSCFIISWSSFRGLTRVPCNFFLAVFLNGTGSYVIDWQEPRTKLHSRFLVVVFTNWILLENTQFGKCRQAMQNHNLYSENENSYSFPLHSIGSWFLTFVLIGGFPLLFVLSCLVEVFAPLFLSRKLAVTYS